MSRQHKRPPIPRGDIMPAYQLRPRTDVLAFIASLGSVSSEPEFRALGAACFEELAGMFKGKVLA